MQLQHQQAATEDSWKVEVSGFSLAGCPCADCMRGNPPRQCGESPASKADAYVMGLHLRYGDWLKQQQSQDPPGSARLVRRSRSEDPTFMTEDTQLALGLAASCKIGPEVPPDTDGGVDSLAKSLCEMSCAEVLAVAVKDIISYGDIDRFEEDFEAFLRRTGLEPGLAKRYLALVGNDLEGLLQLLMSKGCRLDDLIQPAHRDLVRAAWYDVCQQTPPRIPVDQFVDLLVYLDGIRRHMTLRQSSRVHTETLKLAPSAVLAAANVDRSQPGRWRVLVDPGTRTEAIHRGVESQPPPIVSAQASSSGASADRIESSRDPAVGDSVDDYVDMPPMGPFTPEDSDRYWAHHQASLVRDKDLDVSEATARAAAREEKALRAHVADSMADLRSDMDAKGMQNTEEYMLLFRDNLSIAEIIAGQTEPIRGSPIQRAMNRARAAHDAMEGDRYVDAPEEPAADTVKATADTPENTIESAYRYSPGGEPLGPYTHEDGLNNGGIRSIWFAHALTRDLRQIETILLEDGYNVEYTLHKEDQPAASGLPRYEVRCDDNRFEVHIGHKRNETRRPEDRIVIKGFRKWRSERRGGILILDRVRALLALLPAELPSAVATAASASAAACAGALAFLSSRQIYGQSHRAGTLPRCTDYSRIACGDPHCYRWRIRDWSVRG